MDTVRVLDKTARCMQRLGYLKYLVNRCAVTETSSLESLGRDLIDAVTRSVQVTLDDDLLLYIKRRLTDATYREIKRQLIRSKGKEPSDTLYLELQDAHLASGILPSRTGKLVPEDWRKYPLLGVNIGLIRKGTYSSLVRGQVLIRLCQNDEIEAFRKYLPETNPFCLSLHQKLFFLFCLVESDGDVLKRLYAPILEQSNGTFTDRDAGDFLPRVYREEERQLRGRVLSLEDRDHLQKLLSIAESIERWRGKAYTGGGARIEAITPRLEPLVDTGLLAKADPFRYEYSVSPTGKAFFQNFTEGIEVNHFLTQSFFKTCAEAFNMQARPVDSPEAIIEALYHACREIKSPLGYAPIEDLALLAGIRSLVEQGKYFEVLEATQILKEFQKSQPHAVRFNIDRMGNLAYVKFVDEELHLAMGR